jgi:acyl-CoA dehydrogenase
MIETASERLYQRIRDDDPESWSMIQDLLDRMPGWVEQSDRLGDIPAEFWSPTPADVLNRINMPVEFGGLPLTATALRRAVVFERIGRICPGMPMAMPGPSLSTPPVAALGTAEQKARYFGGFTERGEPVWSAFAITEPQAGSDAVAIRTVAVADGDGWIINGAKCFITSGARAEKVVVFASIAPDKGRFGIRAFVVERGTPGFTVERCEDMMGLRASQLASLSFVDCRVPNASMLGHTGRRGPLIDAFAGAQRAWDYMRPALAAGMNGTCLGMLDLAERALDDDEAALPAMRLAAARDELALFRERVESARLLALRAAWQFDTDQRASLAASMAKAFSASLAMELAHRLATLFPLRALHCGDRIEKFYRDAKAFDIVEGTGDMQRLMIAGAFQGGVQ